MTARRPITLPAIAPSEWTLTLPDYPVIINSWRSAVYPELLGNLPSGAVWALVFRGILSDQALSILRLWNATGGGLWSLTSLPEEMAAGVNNEAFKDRLLKTTWAITKAPDLQPVKNGRFNVSVQLVYELTFSSTYGPAGQQPPDLIEIPLPLRISPVFFAPFEPFERIRPSRPADDAIPLNVPGRIVVAGACVTSERVYRERNADLAAALSLSSSLKIASSGPTFVPEIASKEMPADDAISAAIASTFRVAGSNPSLLPDTPPQGSTDGTPGTTQFLLRYIQDFSDSAVPTRGFTVFGGPQIVQGGGLNGANHGAFVGDGYIAYQDMQFYAQDYTFETYAFPANISDRIIFSQNDGNNTQGFRLRPDGRISVYWEAQEILSAPGLIQVNTWHHLAIAREITGPGQSVTRLFVNGSVVGSSTQFGMVMKINVIGAMFLNGNHNFGTSFVGKLNFTRAKDACLYKANFTPPTPPS